MPADSPRARGTERLRERWAGPLARQVSRRRHESVRCVVSMKSWVVFALAMPIAGCVATPTPQGHQAGCALAASEALMQPGERAVFTPTGPEDVSTTSARVVRVDMRGTVTVESERGPMDVWVVDASRYRFGDPIDVRMAVRAVQVERRPESEAPAPATIPRWTEPGDHAIVTGRTLSVNQRGTITVDSPRGPIRIWATLDPDRYCVGRWVEVSTRVSPTP